MRTRANGEGTIYQNSNGTWTAQITTQTGRPSKTFTTQRKARTWLTEQRRDMDTGDYIDPSEMPLGTWWDLWIENHKKREVTPATLNSYAASRKRLSALFLKKAICSIKAVDAQAELNRLDDAGLSRRTIEITRTALLMCLERAVTDHMIRINPIRTTTLPDDDSVPSVPLTIEEETELVKALTRPVRLTAKNQPDKREMATKTIEDALLFALKTGARRGETVMLKWDDIIGHKIHIRGTKNEYSDRIIPMPADVSDMLNRRKFTANGEYVFSTRSGKPLDGSNLLRWMSDHTNHTVHDLRHTYCTRAAQADINPKVLQTLTGHKRIETLLKIYTHVTDKQREQAAAKLTAYCKSTANA